MERTFQRNARVTTHFTQISFSKGVGWGLVGGVAGTLVMDLVLMGALSAFGLPPLTCFSIVGSTVARAFSIQSLDASRAIQMGMVTHYLIGPVIGAIFGVLVARVKALGVNSLKKSMLWGILYVEILSQPLLLMTPLLLKMTATETLQWYGGAFMMHLIAGIVLGAVVGKGLRLAIAVHN